MISRKIIFFPVFGCIPENSLKNILQCLEQHKIKIKIKKFINPLQSANPPPQSSDNQPQITIKKTHKPTITANPQTQQTRIPANPETH